MIIYYNLLELLSDIFLMQTITQGLTGEIKFDNEGLRTLFTLDVVELKSSGLEKVGSWHQETGLNITRMSLPTSTDEGTLSNRSFIVITALVYPLLFFMDELIFVSIYIPYIESTVWNAQGFGQ